MCQSTLITVHHIWWQMQTFNMNNTFSHQTFTYKFFYVWLFGEFAVAYRKISHTYNTNALTHIRNATGLTWYRGTHAKPCMIPSCWPHHTILTQCSLLTATNLVFLALCVNLRPINTQWGTLNLLLEQKVSRKKRADQDHMDILLLVCWIYIK